jgi:hypothetical protein
MPTKAWVGLPKLGMADARGARTPRSPCSKSAGAFLLMSGLGTRLISVPFIIEMIVAMLSTKITLYLGTYPLPPPPAPPVMGGWAVLHEIRSEYAQIMTCIYLLVAGPGPWSHREPGRNFRSGAGRNADTARSSTKRLLDRRGGGISSC